MNKYIINNNTTMEAKSIRDAIDYYTTRELEPVFKIEEIEKEAIKYPALMVRDELGSLE